MAQFQVSAVTALSTRLGAVASEVSSVEPKQTERSFKVQILRKSTLLQGTTL